MASVSNVVISSLWRNDADRNLEQRAEHLLLKWRKGVRYVWVVGNCIDDTEDRLRKIADDARANDGIDVEIVHFDVTDDSEDPTLRLARLSVVANAGFDRVRKADKWWISHESDLISPDDLVDQLLKAPGDVVGGWITLGETMFYDTFAYRVNGQMLTNDAARPAEPFELDSVGSVFMFPAEQLRQGVRCYTGGVVELCNKMRANGLHVWCDPSIHVIQPPELFTSRHHANI